MTAPDPWGLLPLFAVLIDIAANDPCAPAEQSSRPAEPRDEPELPAITSVPDPLPTAA